jgi:RHS repeat-associated protein
MTFVYDSADRLTRVNDPNGQSLTYTYNSGGQRMQMQDQTGFTVNYAYDTAGRLSSMTDSSGNLIVRYTYDAVGRLARKDLGNGTFTVYSYDAAGEVLSIVNHAPDGSVNSQYSYTYDVLGNPITETGPSGTTRYTYDADGQLTSASLPGGRTITYQYDAAGNRTAVTDNGVTTLYTANDLNEYTQVGNATYTYDADGNLATKIDATGTTTYAFNDLNQLTSVSGPGGVFSYQYDPLGNRIVTTHAGQTTQDLVDPTGLPTVFGEFDGSGQSIAHYTFGLDLASRTDASGTGYYESNLVGSITGITGASGGYLNTYSYLPFGQVLATIGSTPNPFTFVGSLGVSSDGSGLLSMRNRNYDPTLGQFASIDPLGLRGGDLNLRRYASNSPLLLADPSGLDVIHITDFAYKDGQMVLDQFGQPVKMQYPVNYQDYMQSLKDAANYTQNEILNNYRPIDAAKYLDVLNQQGKLGPYSPFPGTPGVEPDVPPGSTSPLEPFVYPGGTGLLLPVVVGPTLVAPEIAPLIVLPLLGYLAGDAFAKNLANLLNGIAFIWSAFDPNDILGPAGFGAQGFVTKNRTFSYQIDFQNVATATAPAQAVVVTQALDPNLDWTTFQLGDMAFGNTVVHVPAGRNAYLVRVDDRNHSGLFVDVTAALDFNTGLVTWTFTSIDPTSLDAPSDPLAGFLPPDATVPQGEGYVTYSVRPKASLGTGAVVAAKATIVFDQNAPIDTNSVSNTIDADPPTSSISPLPTTTTSPSLTVSWSGSDGAGSGITGYDVYVSDNGGAFQPFVVDTTATSALFTGQVGHTYRFYSVATDNVGFVQPAPGAAQATIAVVAPPSTTNPPPTSTPPSHSVPSLVTMADVQLVLNKKHQVTQILVMFSGAVDAGEADSLGSYRLATAGKKGSFDAKNAQVLRLKSAVYDAAHHTVLLTLKKPFALKKAVQLRVDGVSPAGLKDPSGRLIDGDRDGRPGGNAIAILSRGGASISAILNASSNHQSITPNAALVDALLASDHRLDRPRSRSRW